MQADQLPGSLRSQGEMIIPRPVGAEVAGCRWVFCITRMMLVAMVSAVCKHPIYSPSRGETPTAANTFQKAFILKANLQLLQQLLQLGESMASVGRQVGVFHTNHRRSRHPAISHSQNTREQTRAVTRFTNRKWLSGVSDWTFQRC